MFYSSQILARKGPLGVVWMAAHLDGQLKRSQVCRNAGSMMRDERTCDEGGNWCSHVHSCTGQPIFVTKHHTTMHAGL